MHGECAHKVVYKTAPLSTSSPFSYENRTGCRAWRGGVTKNAMFPMVLACSKFKYDLGTRQNHGGLRFSEFAAAFDQSVINVSILGFKIEAWHKLIPNADFKVQAQAYANSL